MMTNLRVKKRDWQRTCGTLRVVVWWQRRHSEPQRLGHHVIHRILFERTVK